MSQFSNQTAIVTGATQGLGEMTARLLVERGLSRIVITGRNQERGEAVAGDLRKFGCETLFVVADLEQPDACQNIVAEARSRFDEINILVNAAPPQFNSPCPI